MAAPPYAYSPCRHLHGRHSRRRLLGTAACGLLVGLAAPWVDAATGRRRAGPDDVDAPAEAAASASADAPADTPADTPPDNAFVVPAGEAVRIERFSVYGRSLAAMEVPRVMRSDTEWRVRLSPLAFRVTRQGDTEPAFSGRYLHNHTAGLYRCICCGTALFDSRSQFKAGSGWLNFHAPVSAFNVALSLRNEADASGEVHELAVSCRRCAAHVGEVFDDGPPPTDLRYRVDSVALYFVAYPPY